MKVRPSQRRRFIETIPPYSLWVEGDNTEKSKDSRSYGPVSKKLMEGHAKYLIWPPSRWGKIQRVPPTIGTAWWT